MSTRSIALMAGVVLVVYAVVFGLTIEPGELPAITPAMVVVLAVAVLLQIGAVWLFGELFRVGIEATGRSISTGLGFRAALVGSTVARLLPAGGAVTPVAMAWTVRREAPGSGAAALRATGLNYGGLLVVTAVGLLVASGSLTNWQDEVRVMAILSFVIGAVVLTAATRLGSLGRLLPEAIRSRLGPAPVDQPIGLRSHAYVWGRVAAEVVVLGVVLSLFSIDLGWPHVAAAFGVSQVAAGIPGTPGGIGFAEAGLVGALSLFGVAAVTAVAPVLIFRIVSYWIPAGAGLLAGTTVFLRSPELVSRA